MLGSPGQPPILERAESGISGLDLILQGGLFRGGMYLLMGPPGAGKTILGNQVCFQHVAAGGRALYMTLLAESHSRMLAHMQSFTFYNANALAETLSYISAYSVLEQEGSEGLLRLIRRELRRQKADLLVVDGAATINQNIESIQEWKQFLHSLHVLAESLNCTVILLMQYDDGGYDKPEHTMVDGIFQLSLRPMDMRSVREIQILKFRGSAFLEGRHLFKITPRGIEIYPRTEAVFSLTSYELSNSLKTTDRLRLFPTGVKQLDEMLSGGFPEDSTTGLLGAPGSGKTLLGLQFLLEGVRKQEHSLYFGFYETPAQIIRRMKSLGLPVSKYVDSGLLTLQWQPPVEDILDVLAERLLESIEKTQAQRVFIDGLTGFQRTVASSQRLDLFLTALFSRLRTLGVTTLCSVELPDIFHPTNAVPELVYTATALVENVLFLRYVELNSQQYRLVSIIKMRESKYDSSVREFQITDRGINIETTFTSAEQILGKKTALLERNLLSSQEVSQDAQVEPGGDPV